MGGVRFPKIENGPKQLLIRLIDLIYLLFNMDKKQRNSFLAQDIFTIKDQTIMKILIDLQNLESYDFNCQNDKIAELYNILSLYLDSKKEYSLSDYIDSIFIDLSFVPQLEKLLKFQIFSSIIRFYLNLYNIKYSFHEKEINIQDETSLDLIIHLFHKEDATFYIIVQSLVI